MPCRLELHPDLVDQIRLSTKKHRAKDGLDELSADLDKVDDPEDLKYAAHDRRGRPVFVINGLVFLYQFDPVQKKCWIMAFSI